MKIFSCKKNPPHLAEEIFLKATKPPRLTEALGIFFFGRNDETWTHDLFHPKEALYQTELRPEHLRSLPQGKNFCKHFLLQGFGQRDDVV